MRAALSPILILLLLPVWARADSGPPTTDSRESDVIASYLATIQEQDWPGMAEVLSDDASYRDVTMEHFGRDAIDLRGRAAITEFWRESSRDAGTRSILFDYPRRFRAGSHHVLIGESRVEIEGSAWGLPVPILRTAFPVVTHLRIENGRVTHHTDHVDYGAAERQIAEQVEAYNAKVGTTASFPVSPVDDSLVERALRYLRDLHSGDEAGAREALSTDARYRNDTAESLTGAAEVVVGREAVLELFRESYRRSATRELAFEPDLEFLAGSNVILAGIYEGETAGAPWGAEAERVTFRMPMVVHLRFDREGRILEHSELLGYEDALAGLSPLP